MTRQPLAEVFGFPSDDFSPQATRSRRLRLCPYNNHVPSCTKDKANDPLGVCTIHDGDELAITCPIRFRQDWLVAENAATFFFPPAAHWTTLTEVRLNDRHGKSAGNIDVVLVSYDDDGRLTDFGALEVQAVYISGNVRRPFKEYMKDPEKIAQFDWSSETLYPRPDYLSSSRKRLAPQLIFKGGILHSWGKKQAIAIHNGFFVTLPKFPVVSAAEADVVWLVYDLKYDAALHRYNLFLAQTVYSHFKLALDKITVAEPGPMEKFVAHLQTKLDEKLEDNNPPDAPLLTDLIDS